MYPAYELTVALLVPIVGESRYRVGAPRGEKEVSRSESGKWVSVQRHPQLTERENKEALSGYYSST